MTFMSVMPNLYTADVERAVAFYRDLLGCTQTFRTPAVGPAEHVELRLGDITIALSSRDAVQEEGLPAPTAGHPMELVVWCHGHRRAYVADPDGNWIVLVSKKGA